MKFKVFIIVTVLLVVSLSTAYAGNSRRAGTAGAQELLIPFGSRGTAMGGAVISTVTGVESMYWNPAGLASLQGTEAMFTHLPYIADIDVNFVGVATAVEGFGTIGAGAKVVSVGDMEETTYEFPDGTGRIYAPSLTVINLSFARILTANVSFGATAMFINEQIFEASATGMAFDVGFLYDPRWNGVSVGLSIKNYGAEMKFGGRGFNETSADGYQTAALAAPFDLPSSIIMGASWNFIDDEKNLASLAGNFRSNNYSEDFWQSGAEYVYDGKYSLRAGYNFSDDDTYIYGFAFGAGVMFDLGSAKLNFDYSWTETDVFDDNQYFTLRVKF